MHAAPITIEDEDGVEHELPTCWEICGTCRGEGQHAHAIDGNGITASEWAEWEPEERADYRAGRYDRACEDCGGTGKVRVVDTDACPPALLALYEDERQADADYAAERAAERRMGA